MMRQLRAWCFYLLCAVTVIPVGVACLLTWPVLPRRVRYERIALPWARFCIRMLEVLCGVRYRVLGEENIPRDGRPLVVLSKHQSAWETMFLPVYLGHPMGFVYKKSLHWIPFFGWALKSMGMIAIDRSKGRSAYQVFLERGRIFMRSGWWVTLFPEGTRTAPGVRSTLYKTGGVRFACSGGADILPVALNSGRCWPRNSVAKSPGVITVSFGPVISTKGREARELNEEVQNWIEDEIERFECVDKTDRG